MTKENKEKTQEVKAEEQTVEATDQGAIDPEQGKTVDKAEVPATTAGEMMKDTETRTVPEATFLSEKMGRKQLEKEKKALEAQIKELQAAKSAGATNSEISSDLSSLADEFNLDKSFVAKLDAVISAKTARETESKLQPLLEKERQAKLDMQFEKAYKATIATSPEFAKIANPAVVKSQFFAAKDKTVAQVLDSIYGNVIPGKATIEETTSGGGKEPAPLDVERANRDTKYFKEVMANPKLKAEYNQRQILERGL